MRNDNPYQKENVWKWKCDIPIVGRVGLTFKEESISDKKCVKDSISILPCLLVDFSLNACTTSSSTCHFMHNLATKKKGLREKEPHVREAMTTQQ